MHRTKGGCMPPSGERGETHRIIVAELASVIEHVRKSLRRIEQVVASEADIGEPVADNVIVLDDVTPLYARADAVLRECHADLRLALRLLHGPNASRDMTSGNPGGEAFSMPAHWPVSA